MEIKKTSLILFFCYLILISYLVFLSFNTKIIEITVEQKNNEWFITSIYDKSWGDSLGIKEGNKVTHINGQKIKNLSHEKSFKIRTANTLTIINDKKAFELEVKQSKNELFFKAIKLLYIVLVGFIALYLLIGKEHGFIQPTTFIIFLLTTTVAYISVDLSVSDHILGWPLLSTSMILSLVLLTHYTHIYVQHLKQRTPYKLFTISLYSIVILNIAMLLQPSMNTFMTTFVLVMVVGLFVLSLALLMQGYVQLKSKQLLLLIFCLIVPCLPFMLLFALPTAVFGVALIPADVAMLFTVFIPISFLLVQLPERLVDLSYQMPRLRYFSAFAISTSTILAIVMYIMFNLPLYQLGWLFVTTVLTIIISLYIKERVDYNKRHILYSPQGGYIQLVYNSVERMRDATTVTELLHLCLDEIKKQLHIQQVHMYEYNLIDGAVMTNTIPGITKAQVEKARTGRMIKYDDGYALCIYHTLDAKYIITLTDSDIFHIKREEILCLELLSYYTNYFIEQTKRVEDLIQELQRMKSAGVSQPGWLNQLLWQQLEEDKRLLAQELHDTVLQEQIHIIRKLENVDTPFVNEQRIQLMKTNQVLRHYCEQLKPPLLHEKGLTIALTRLCENIEEKTPLTILLRDTSEDYHNEAMALAIFRSIQELLNNTLKHADASEVIITLNTIDDELYVTYSDDGIGFDLAILEQTSSMGLNGIRDRIKAFGGEMTIESEPNEGMFVNIIIKER